jgi:uncharacterized membrane protein
MINMTSIAEIDMKKFFDRVFTQNNVMNLNLFVVGFCVALAVAIYLRGDVWGAVLNVFLALLNLGSYLNLKTIKDLRAPDRG